jgi:mannose-1-phosphate guanylyltransferase
MAALEIATSNVESILVVVSADHLIKDVDIFREIIHRAVKVAMNDSMVVLGVKPTRPETGCCHILTSGLPGVFGDIRILNFVKKPNLAAAIEYVASSSYFWSFEIFIVKASFWL